MCLMPSTQKEYLEAPDWTTRRLLRKTGVCCECPATAFHDGPPWNSPGWNFDFAGGPRIDNACATAVAAAIDQTYTGSGAFPDVAWFKFPPVPIGHYHATLDWGNGSDAGGVVYSGTSCAGLGVEGGLGSSPGSPHSFFNLSVVDPGGNPNITKTFYIMVAPAAPGGLSYFSVSLKRHWENGP